jgi:lipoprotein-anchoring transpeptidase ErfK/SrfK
MMHKTMTPALAIAFAVLTLGSCASLHASDRAQQPLTLEASLSQRTLEVRRGSTVVATFPIAVGKPGHSTPRGTFGIQKLIWNPRWVPPDSPWARGKKATPPGDPNNPMQGVKIFFREPTYYIHGTNDEASIGRAASHGCIRMTPEDAAQVARWIMEHGGEPRPESWFQRIRRAVTREHVVELPTPVVLNIRS